VPLEVIWSVRARKRLEEIRAYIANAKPEAAQRLSARIVVLVEVLKDFPLLGRMGAEPGVRELIVGGTPYIIFYRVLGKRVTIITIWHGAQLKRSGPPEKKMTLPAYWLKTTTLAEAGHRPSIPIASCSQPAIT
jgi:addiction module RelE/StbE family toxin